MNIEFFTQIYVSILPIVIAATVSTIIVKLPIFRRLRAPIDAGRFAYDGERIFGDNKTWVGLAGLIVFGAITMIAWGYICAKNPGLNDLNLFYRTFENTAGYNLVAGSLMGLMYAVFELPNSYLKRRQGIKAGEIVAGWRGVPNILLDHTDSIIGCAVVMLVLCPLSFTEMLATIVVGSVTHLLINLLLVATKAKKNI